jgi:hypothetical protein
MIQHACWLFLTDASLRTGLLEEVRACAQPLHAARALLQPT